MAATSDQQRALTRSSHTRSVSYFRQIEFHSFISVSFCVCRSSFYKMRAERIEWFAKRDPFATEIQELLDIGVFLPLKEKDENGCQIFIIRTGVHSPKKHQQNDVFKVIDRISVDKQLMAWHYEGASLFPATFDYRLSSSVRL